MGFRLGLGGTTFAIGVPLVNSWFPPARRGAAIGAFGMGMGGTALSAYFTPRLVKSHGMNYPFILVAVLLAAYGLLAIFLVSDRPDRPIPTRPLLARLTEAGRLRVTWELSALYAVGFGGIVAFGVYLPTYLKNLYHLSQTEAGTKAAGFAILAVVLRPIGGWLSDRIHPALVAAASFLTVAVFAIVQSFDPKLYPVGTIAMLGMAAALGASAGAVFALVAKVTPQAQVGSVTGIVGAIGGLGGFIPPLLMGAVYGAKGSYSIGLMLLSAWRWPQWSTPPCACGEPEVQTRRRTAVCFYCGCREIPLISDYIAEHEHVTDLGAMLVTALRRTDWNPIGAVRKGACSPRCTTMTPTATTSTS